MKVINISGKFFSNEDPDFAMDKAAQELHDAVVAYIGACRLSAYSFTDDEIDDMIANVCCTAINGRLKGISFPNAPFIPLIDMDGNEL